MRLICLWCAVLALAYGQVRDDGFYAPQTFRQHGMASRGLFSPVHRQWSHMMHVPNRIEAYQNGLFQPSGGIRNDVLPQSSINEPWRPVQAQEPWRTNPAGLIQGSQSQGSYQGTQNQGAPFPNVGRPIEPWRPPVALTKEQQANIVHHKQALNSDGSFRFEYASDNGLAAGEVIEPDGSRVGAYQYKDPNGQVVKLKYRAGKDGFQILEGSHLPKSPEPVAPPQHEYQQAYEQQRQQYQLQQQHNQERPTQQQQQLWTEPADAARPASNLYMTQNWEGKNREDDGQYRENDLEDDPNNRGPHTFGEGYAFSFQG